MEERGSVRPPLRVRRPPWPPADGDNSGAGRHPTRCTPHHTLCIGDHPGAPGATGAAVPDRDTRTRGLQCRGQSGPVRGLLHQVHRGDPQPVPQGLRARVQPPQEAGGASPQGARCPRQQTRVVLLLEAPAAATQAPTQGGTWRHGHGHGHGHDHRRRYRHSSCTCSTWVLGGRQGCGGWVGRRSQGEPAAPGSRRPCCM